MVRGAPAAGPHSRGRADGPVHRPVRDGVLYAAHRRAERREPARHTADTADVAALADRVPDRTATERSPAPPGRSSSSGEPGRARYDATPYRARRHALDSPPATGPRTGSGADLPVGVPTLHGTPSPPGPAERRATRRRLSGPVGRAAVGGPAAPSDIRPTHRRRPVGASGGGRAALVRAPRASSSFIPGV
ncbi:hypothetical protein SSP531S_55730 [Streptomyces spongiicola]|uniref:Uncharacterized protein n=1 Tax=Streptomyces spongiicola TaxID=1690221 RepID=A0A388T543_9ACTN|nr:hypothetical protein SSP531S_55730 [Streptomyces spongiicola]